jgi:hypothetical protein
MRTNTISNISNPLPTFANTIAAIATRTYTISNANTDTESIDRRMRTCPRKLQQRALRL